MSLLVATDLDACLLDATGYRYDEARGALARLKQEGAILVLSSSKTRAEIEPIVGELDTRAPFVVENGGAIVMPEGHVAVSRADARRNGNAVSVVLGAEHARLASALNEIGGECGLMLKGMTVMSLQEIQDLTGLSASQAMKAQRREYDEPFLAPADADVEALRRAAERRGLRVTRGGRFHHLTGPTDKGRALVELLAIYRAAGRFFTVVALGDSANDLSMLQAADRPIVVPRPSGAPDPELREALPYAEIAPLPGPAGWNRAMVAVLDGERLPRAGEATKGGDRE
ncbi:MAG: HAD-IIB family hydrolase [Vicinamibacteria bacterium]|nr:HAD-IIB family hydrolase [Vicinamibacteria bacterium]